MCCCKVQPVESPVTVIPDRGLLMFSGFGNNKISRGTDTERGPTSPWAALHTKAKLPPFQMSYPEPHWLNWSDYPPSPPALNSNLGSLLEQRSRVETLENWGNFGQRRGECSQQTTALFGRVSGGFGFRGRPADLVACRLN